MHVAGWLDAVDARRELDLVLEGEFVRYGMPAWLKITAAGGGYRFRYQEHGDGAGPGRSFDAQHDRAGAEQLLAGLLADDRPVRNRE